ncbi:DUF819 domain-containing protein [Haliangium ochraceum]|uniref:DUF819 family protein n=1 Tax=Haliangium ochraceum (strain DSM 14365 / JCM 11303 / SMP-2) TaxID=502025 RepID=D0LSG1_HALO1|nr:DUF819 family protein [Haliangium ochraceum]ACY15660.1 protein of unknown function DUF819 [Haliangium ochraceum DSM 14365]
MIQEPTAIVAVLLAVLAVLFLAARWPVTERLFRIVPLLLFAYFVPTLLSTFDVIPSEAPVYGWIKNWLLPASLILMTLSADIPSILRLGRNVLVLFVSATASIVIGGPLAYLALGWVVPPELGDQAWRGLAALAGSWIGGGANFLAIGESVGAGNEIIGIMIVVDVAVANVWMAALLFFAGRSRSMDQAIGADRDSLEALRTRVQAYHDSTARPTTTADLMAIAALAFGGTALAHLAAPHLPETSITSQFVWVVLVATTIGTVLSFSPVRKLDGGGASAVGSVFIYLLVTSIGATADFSRVLDYGGLVVVGALWMLFHAVIMLVVRRLLRAPIFFAAVGSQANVGGAASAPVVAAAFHPSLAPVGVLLAVGGYVLGTYMALACAFLLELVYSMYFAL